MIGKPCVLFLCTHNSARSQMGEGWLRHLAADKFEVLSAGTEPSRLHPLAARVMTEIGIDITTHTSGTSPSATPSSSAPAPAASARAFIRPSGKSCIGRSTTRPPRRAPRTSNWPNSAACATKSANGSAPGSPRSRR